MPLTTSPGMALLGHDGLTWPWESLHVEGLAWFDHWLKDRDTGILEGPPVRYWLPGADAWLESPDWPPPGWGCAPVRCVPKESSPTTRASPANGPTVGSRPPCAGAIPSTSTPPHCRPMLLPVAEVPLTGEGGA